MVEIGDYVCVRSRNQGVVFGVLQWINGCECGLTETRQLFNWQSGATTLFDVLLKGPKSVQARLSGTLEEGGRMTEICGVWKVPEKHQLAFREHAAA